MIIVELLRVYGPHGTNGEIRIGGILVSYAIELPWRDNARSISCIPEGSYLLNKRYSKKFKWHILVKDVPERSAILFHPANHAEKELRGCIAPVRQLTGEGLGLESTPAMERLKKIVYKALDGGEVVHLVVSKKEV